MRDVPTIITSVAVLLSMVEGILERISTKANRTGGNDHGCARSGREKNVSAGDGRRETGRGRHASTPSEIPARGWKDILLRVYQPSPLIGCVSTSSAVLIDRFLAGEAADMVVSICGGATGHAGYGPLLPTADSIKSAAKFGGVQK